MSETKGRSKMKKYLLAAVAALALTSGASARDVDPTSDWVLLTLGWQNGEGATMQTPPGLVPEFATKAACQAVLRRELQQNRLLSHAEGGGNGYLCYRVSAFAY
jgi:opacity protein-like surface antigen